MIAKGAARRSARAAVSVALAALAALAACNGQFRFDDAPLGGVEAGAPGVDAAPTADAPETPAHVPDTSGQPVPVPACGGDPECKLPTLHCDVVARACVACIVDAQCTGEGAHRCDAALHRCVECGVDGDCGSEGKCEPITRRCVHRCAKLTDCIGEAPFCDFDRGFCLRCHGDLECIIPGDARTCDTANGKCVECLDDGQCRQQKPRCDRTAGTCAQCLTSADCKAGAPYCDPVTRACVGG